jgi:hypothetical protein
MLDLLGWEGLWSTGPGVGRSGRACLFLGPGGARPRDAAVRRAVDCRLAGHGCLEQGEETEALTPLCQDAATVRAGARFWRRGAECPCTGRQRVLVLSTS